jgi:hypothetical protein
MMLGISSKIRLSGTWEFEVACLHEPRAERIELGPLQPEEWVTCLMSRAAHSFVCSAMKRQECNQRVPTEM